MSEIPQALVRSGPVIVLVVAPIVPPFKLVVGNCVVVLTPILKLSEPVPPFIAKLDDDTAASSSNVPEPVCPIFNVTTAPVEVILLATFKVPELLVKVIALPFPLIAPPTVIAPPITTNGSS